MMNSEIFVATALLDDIVFFTKYYRSDGKTQAEVARDFEESLIAEHGDQGWSIFIKTVEKHEVPVAIQEAFEDKA